jgi:hypothetical protein
MTTPAVECLRLYREQGKRDFLEDVLWHTKNGIFYAGPDCLLMARPVRKDWPDMFHDVRRAELFGADAWFVWMAIGRGYLKRFFELAPVDLPWVIFDRKDGRRRAVFGFHSLRRRVGGRCGPGGLGGRKDKRYGQHAR